MGDDSTQQAMIAAVEEKVQRWLAEFVGGYEVDQAGRVSFQHGSARIFVNVYPWASDGSLVTVGTLVVSGIPKSPELNEWVAYNAGSYVFGSFNLAENRQDPAKADLIFDHSLLGDYIDLEEFRTAVGGVAHIADDLDNELSERFGGEVYLEDSD